ncbi:hypothetical protein ASPZODRAFT_138956 [Penicilliopsis zonata CBS 506.65]|uniref:DUF7730 domain-containing protein n=1 Tax=Penicilliopsis zonata CBS 506.65 TaxID=1073090 RepID=A0A1L9SQR2_9EURO|nr:hypothetical protein ASPZODRAFT_138956 [Penicilliopsis zonata CBS 506.65]OJJ49569.1 hypothetical protein ASPZODRAFT_138956 [Penicilliopsis zonata CBS 506.65]
MRHFDAWLLRDPYSIFHYYPTGRRWQETVRDLIQERKICSPSVNDDDDDAPASPVNLFDQPFSSQSECSLLQKLPAEIRLLIYQYVFGNETVHLVQLKGKIRHVRCQHVQSSMQSHRRCCPVTRARWNDNNSNTNSTASTTNRFDKGDTALYPHTHPCLPSSLSNSSPALLRTCRAVYAEAATLLYSRVTFDVDDLHTLIAFLASVSPAQLRCIHSLTVQYMTIWQPMTGEEHPSSIYAHTHNDRLWVKFWSRVAALQGLEELRVSLDLGSFRSIPDPNQNQNQAVTGLLLENKKRLRLSIDQPWVAPLLDIRGLDSFELGITAKCDAFAKRILEADLCRDAATLRDDLQHVLCSDRLSLTQHSVGSARGTGKPRLAITAA